ncbi:MAG: multiple sugar transport system ATP-binding protein [Bradymonadia bacterium]|jgi:multiple sugar transport system ATP-binding protein
MASVTLSDIRKSFGDVKVVKGVDLEIRDGEFLVLVGSSGCGKSTLLRMVAGLETPNSGEIRIGPRVVNELPPRERDIAMVFQSYALYPHMTVRENMAFGLKVRGESPKAINSAVTDAARTLDIEHLLDRKPAAMSGGQRQRVAMGRALVRRPQVFLFDEPLSNLDAGLRAKMRVELKKQHQRLGVTTIYVTHDQVEAMTLADRIALLDKGVLQQVGTPAELYEWPVNAYTASFLGNPGMNFVDARLDHTKVSATDVRLRANPEYLDDPSIACAVRVGVRPEAMHLAGESEDCSFDATVDVLEPMGWETHAHLSVDGNAWIGRFQSDDVVDVKPGQRLRVYVRPADVRLFGADDHKALCRPPAS